MKIRDIRKYVKAKCGTDSTANLGTNNDELLNTMYGVGSNINAVINDIANFANQSQEQLFYECAQNAIDAKADSLMFFANEHYLVVLNNGEPFHTDIGKSSDGNDRKGQLYNFLAKGKSLNFSDEEKLGKFGQGSKLLYTLLSEVNDNKNETLLLKAIKEDKKGPYLISWNSQEQLTNFLLDRNSWDYADPTDEERNMLVIKILMCYYPILPGVDQELFSDKEMSDAIKAFDTLVDPRRNMNRLKHGTALIIPLGQGKYDLIKAEENINNVLIRLSGFVSFILNPKRKHRKEIKYISVLGKEVEVAPNPFAIVIVEFDVDGEAFSYEFAFSPNFAKQESVNFYSALPILDTKYRLGFVVDSEYFELEGSRQRLQDMHKTKNHLERAFKKLVEKLTQLRASNKAFFDHIYTSIISSAIPEGNDFSFVREPFEGVFKPYFEQLIRCEGGEYHSIDFSKSGLRYQK